MQERDRAYVIKNKKLVRTMTFSVALLVTATLIMSGSLTAIELPGKSMNMNSKLIVEHTSATLADTEGYHGVDQVYVAPQPNDIWDLEFQYDVGGDTGSLYLVGCGFDGTYFYFPEFASSTIYRFDAAGTYIDSFSISGVPNLIDLTYDGTYFYGQGQSPTNVIYEMDFDTQTLVSTISCPHAAWNIAYDEDNDGFWIGQWQNYLSLIDRSGNTLDTITPPESMLGLAYDNTVEHSGYNGPFLWVFTGTSTGGEGIIKCLDLDTKALVSGVEKNVAQELGMGIAGGLELTYDYNVGTSTLIGLTQGAGPPDDYAFGYEISTLIQPDHDVGVRAINSPTSGPAGVITPEVVVKNYGNYSEVTDVQLTIGQFAPPVTLLSEDFESGYAGWTITDGGTSADTWTDLNPCARVGTGGCTGTFMIADSDCAGSGPTMYEILESPSFNCGSAVQVLLDFSHYYWHLSSAAHVEVWDGSTWTNVKTYTSTTTGPEIGLDISSVAAGKTDVKIRFIYDDMGAWAWYWMVDNVEVYQLGGLVNEYDETEYNVNVPVGGEVTVTFPAWTPDDWQMVENVDITYEVVATTLLSDGNPGNDQKTKSATLNYPYLHDIAVLAINSPVDDGPAQTLPVEVVIKNVGQFEECCYKTSAAVGSKLYIDAWQTIAWSGSNTWIQWPYGDHSYEPSACGCNDYYAGCYYTQGGTFDTSLVTYALDLTSTGTSATVQLCEEFQDFAGYGQFGIYVHSGGFPDASGTASSSYEETLYYITVDEIPRYGIYQTWTINPSLYTDAGEVYLEFWYTDDGYGNAWGCGVDCVEIPEIGFYEDFEGTMFPPGEFIVVPEYYDEVCTIELDPGEEATLQFDDWTPDDLQYGISGSIEYGVTATQMLSTDTNPGNDEITESFVLDYWHDVLIKEVLQPPDNGKAPWDFLYSFDLEAATGALGNAGAEWDGTYFYSTRWAANLIHQFDSTGALVKEFSIPGVSGLRDLAYNDATGYFYGGAAGGTIWEMDFASETLVNTLSGGFQSRAIAYNGVDDVIYCSNWGDPVWVVDPASGAINDQFNLATTTSTYGFAYDNGPDGTFLYVFDQGGGGGTPQYIHQWDLVAGAYTPFTYDVTTDIPGTAGIAGGLFIGGGFDPSNLVIGGLLQGTPDYMFVYELRPGGGPQPGPPITRWVAPGTYPIKALVGNDGTFEETGLTCYVDIVEYISDPNGTLIYEDDLGNIDLDPLGDETEVPLGSYDYTMQGGYGLFFEFPLGNDDKTNNNNKALGLGVDATAPTSSHALDPPNPNGLNGWYVSDVTVTLDADDGEDNWQSGVAEIKYTVDGGPVQTIPGNHGSFIISQDKDDLPVEYWAIDNVGNEETPHHTFTIDMDQTDPTVELSYEAPGGYAIIWTATANDATSGMERVEFYVNGVLQTTVTGAGPEYIWEMEYHPLPDVTFTAVAYDFAGNDAYDEIKNPEAHANIHPVVQPKIVKVNPHIR